MKETNRIPLDRGDWLLVVGTVVSSITLMVLLFPDLWNWSVSVLDVRQLSRRTWFVGNLLVVALLFCILVRSRG